MLRSTAVAVALFVGAGSGLAQTADPIVARNELMKSMGGQLYGVVGRMQRGDLPYDQARIDAAFAALEAGSPKVPDLYITKSEQPAANSQFRPNAKIWENKKDFDEKSAAVMKALGEVKGKVRSVEDAKAAFATVNKACTDCHDLYRVKN